jgi:hypothetical protein
LLASQQLKEGLLEGVGGTGAYKADLFMFAREGLPSKSGEAVRKLAGEPEVRRYIWWRRGWGAGKVFRRSECSNLYGNKTLP